LFQLQNFKRVFLNFASGHINLFFHGSLQLYWRIDWIMKCKLCDTLVFYCLLSTHALWLCWVRDGHGPGWIGLGWVGSRFWNFWWVVLRWVKPMGHLTQSVPIDDVYKMNTSYQSIKKWHRRDLRWDPSRLYLVIMCQLKPDNGTLERLSVSISLLGWVGLGVNLSGMGWAGSKKMDPRPTLSQLWSVIQVRLCGKWMMPTNIREIKWQVTLKFEHKCDNSKTNGKGNWWWERTGTGKGRECWRRENSRLFPHLLFYKLTTLCCR